MTYEYDFRSATAARRGFLVLVRHPTAFVGCDDVRRAYQFRERKGFLTRQLIGAITISPPTRFTLERRPPTEYRCRLARSVVEKAAGRPGNIHRGQLSS
jgi:hypothetical protein